MRRLGYFLTAVLPYFAAEAIQSIVANSLVLFYGFLAGFQTGFEEAAGGNLSNERIPKATDMAISQEALYLFAVLGIIVCGIVFFFWYRYEIRGELRGSLKEVLAFKNLALLVVLGVGCQFFFTGMMSLLTPYLINIFTDYAKALQTLTSGNDIIVLLLMILIAPITEELIFRGVILHMANRYVTFLGANILQAVLFGIYHQNIVQGVYGALLGFLLGVIYYKFRSIVAPILLHMIINTSSFLTYLFPGNTWCYLIIMIAGGFFAVVALILVKPFIRVPIRDAEE